MASGFFSMQGATGSNFAVTPDKLTNFEVYLEANRFIGMADVELPDLKFSTTDLKGSAVLGTLQIPGLGHTDSLEVTLNWRTITKNLMELAELKAHDITIRGSQQNYNQANKSIDSEAVRVDFRGLPKQATLGSFKPVEQTESKSVFEVVTLHIYIAGEQVIKYDKVNYICEINGVDYLKDFRANVGLSF